MGLRPLYYFYSYKRGVGGGFRRQILTSEVDPRTVRVKNVSALAPRWTGDLLTIICSEHDMNMNMTWIWTWHEYELVLVYKYKFSIEREN